MKQTILTKQFALGLLLTVGLIWLFVNAPPPTAAPTPDQTALSPVQLRQTFLGDNEVDLLALEMEEELAEMPRYDQPAEAQQFYAAQRAPVGETAIPVERYGIARRQMEDMPQYSTTEGRVLPSRRAMREQGLTAQGIGTWESLGPGNIGGRTRAILIDPDTPDIMYAAGVSGGVWKTTDAGANWTPLDDLLPNIAVNSMAMDPDDSNVIYAGTGEGFFNGDAVRGDGIFKTTDGGTNWTQLANTASITDFHYVNDIVVSPNDSNRVYAATRSGVWRWNNSDTDWTQVLDTADVNGCTDLAIRTDVNPDDTLFAACGTFSQATIYRSTDNGDSWPLGDRFTEANMGRTSLAIAPSDQGTIYAVAASINQFSNYNNGLHAVFRSTNGGDSWNTQVSNTNGTLLNTLLLSNPIVWYCAGQFFNQGWYDNVVAVDPVDPDIVWVGGIDLFRSNDRGETWGQASHWWADPPFLSATTPQYAHADHHAIVFHPDYNGTTNQTMYNGNDGGVFRTDNARAATTTTTTDFCFGNLPDSSITWTHLNNGYGVTQFYHGVPYPDGTTYLGGTQDNGTNRSSDGAGSNAWDEILGGDGGYVAVDPTNTNIVFAENTRLSIKKSTDGGATFSSSLTNGIDSNDSFLFITPFVMDPSNPDRLWLGGRTMWRTEDQADNWVQASAPLVASGGSVSAIAVAPTDSDYVLAGLGLAQGEDDFLNPNDGTIFRTQSGTTANNSTTWNSTQPTNGFVSWLTFDPTDKNIAYATYSTFGVDHVWKSEDAGETWNPIDNRGQPNGIPDIPVHTIAVDPTDTKRLFVGTDLGVFVSPDGGDTWLVENSGFANVVTEALYFNEVDGVHTLFAFTHGRGAFRVTPLVNQAVLEITKTASPDPVTSGQPLTYTIVVENTGALVANSVTITDTVPVSTTLLPDSLSGGGSAGGNTPGSLITWNTGASLDTGQKLTRTFVVTVDTELSTGVQIVNTAYVTATNETQVKSGTVTVTVQAAGTKLYLPTVYKN